eukprot:1546013-Rhodomonas_salina.1
MQMRSSIRNTGTDLSYALTITSTPLPPPRPLYPIPVPRGTHLSYAGMTLSTRLTLCQYRTSPSKCVAAYATPALTSATRSPSPALLSLRRSLLLAPHFLPALHELGLLCLDMRLSLIHI